MKKNKLFKKLVAVIAAMFIAIIALPQDVMAQTKEAYVVENGSTLTFYCDSNKDSRTGTIYGINDKLTSGSNVPAWAGTQDQKNERISKIIIDSSFKGYKPSSTHRWFCFMTKVESIEGLSNLNTDQLTDMSHTFVRCEALKSVDLSGLNTANVTTMLRMFSGCYALTSLDLSSFNTENVTDMYGMFYNCNSLTYLNLSSFNTVNVEDMAYMFAYCSSLVDLNLCSSTLRTLLIWTVCSINAPA